MSQILIETILPAEGNIITQITPKSQGGIAVLEGKNPRTGGNDVFMKGIFMQADMRNRNGRNYPLAVMVDAVDLANATIREHGGIFGELDHPEKLAINMDRISHAICELKMDGNNVIGSARLLDTPMGNIAKVLAESGIRYGVSSRGAGDVGHDGVVNKFKFVTCDLVVTPSAPGAMLTSVNETLEEDVLGRSIMELAVSAKHDPAAQKYLKVSILKFIQSL